MKSRIAECRKARSKAAANAWRSRNVLRGAFRSVGAQIDPQLIRLTNEFVRLGFLNVPRKVGVLYVV